MLPQPKQQKSTEINRNQQFPASSKDFSLISKDALGIVDHRAAWLLHPASNKVSRMKRRTVALVSNLR